MSGLVVWLTGLPSSGKSTLARATATITRGRGVATVVLDGDEVRGVLHPVATYDERGRDDFYATLAGLAASLARQGLLVLVPATANRAAFRARARELAPAFLEVFVDVPLETCAARDTKGLYARARQGDPGAASMPGQGASYEAPTQPDFVARGEATDAEALALRCLARLEQA